MKKVKNIVVVTGSRAEYGILKPLLKKLQLSKDFNIQVIVCGMHLLKHFGHTIDEIKKDGFPIAKKIDMYRGNKNTPTYLGQGLGNGITLFSQALSKMDIDMVLVFGDRLESLAATLASAILHIPVGHIHGGDKTDSGHIDESTRHAIARYSNIHFAPTKNAAQRLIRMGEERFRVHMVGTLSIDALKEVRTISKKVLCEQLHLDAEKEIMVCLFHPLPLEVENMENQAKEICAALTTLQKQTIIIYPNNDEGSDGIIKEIEKLKKLPYVHVYKSLSSEQYINVLRNADVLIGNSSSGIIEAPTLGLPVVNVGSRNIGREHGTNILFTDPKKASIKKAIEKALHDKKFISAVKKSKNPYGGGHTADTIINILRAVDLDSKKLMLKKITY